MTAKSDRRTWSNAKGDGSLFSCDLIDQYGTAMRATFFRDAVDKYFDVVQKGQMYYMSNGKLKAANKQFTSITADYEITFDAHSIIVCVAAAFLVCFHMRLWRIHPWLLLARCRPCSPVAVCVCAAPRRMTPP